MTHLLGADERPELVIALVGAAGTRLDDLSAACREHLKILGYESGEIRLSDLLANFQWDGQQAEGEFHRIRHLQDKGDAFRARLKDGSALALAALTAVRNARALITGSPESPAAAHAYILHQLKHPEEVDLLRRVYGSSFVLLGGHATRKRRVAELAKRLARKAGEIGKESKHEGEANDVIEADEKQDSEFGQNTRDTYPKSDCFVDLNDPSGQYEIRRFIDLLFAHPFLTPSPDEYAMYQASAAALRSSDDSRQVGAVIAKLTRASDSKISNVDIVASGMNEVPRAGGGFYWSGHSPDARDQWLACYMNEDRALDFKTSVLIELIDRIKTETWFKDDVQARAAADLAKDLLPKLRRTRFLELGEFCRPVHAEMAALLDSARRGVAVDGQSMYVTTFPCHNCAKHIIAAGLRRVVYLEPYPKSHANALHGEEIVLESEDGSAASGKVVFSAYTGIAPRQYRTLFAMTERGAKKGLALRAWEADRKNLFPKYVLRNAHRIYLDEERQALEQLSTDLYLWDKATICPSL